MQDRLRMVRSGIARIGFNLVLTPLYRVSAACHFDLNADPANTILITSSGRSGSTWVADIVNYKNEYRLIFEPFRRDRTPVAKDIRYGLYLDPATPFEPPADAIDAILRGRVRTPYSEQRNKRIAVRRIIKDIRTTNLIPWIRANFPVLPIVYLLRHPFAVARSWTRLGWRDYVSEFTSQETLMERLSPFRPVIEKTMKSDGAFERHVLRWCLENYIPLNDITSEDVHLVFYEHLLRDPETEVPRLFGSLGKDFEAGVLERTSAPSATTFATESPTQPTAGYQIARALEIVTAFGLDRIYGADANPKVSLPIDVLRSR
jgi:hypothetical protein